jgi:hypothetical protein
LKLLVPFVGELLPADRRLIRLAEFLGIDCLPLDFTNRLDEFEEFLKTEVPQEDSCFVLNPPVLQRGLRRNRFPANLASVLVRRFPHLLVHAIRLEPFDSSLINALSCGHLQALQEIDRSWKSYEISPDSRDVCGPFAGLSFGPTNILNDRVFLGDMGSSRGRTFISIGSRPFMAGMEWENSKVWFLAGDEIADLDAQVGDTAMPDYFSRLLPHAMALRSIFGEQSWRPREQYASVIIDDPLLRRDYGFLNFDSLLTLMRDHNFHSTLAFIPHNFRRSSPQIARMFRENADQFGLCFHGNDHTGAEFASRDTALLNTLLQVAKQRMELHTETTGVDCDPVMVFPQGKFSVEAMAVLKSHNFEAAVNTVSHPVHESVGLSLAELAQPAVLRYGNFPLFLRKNSLQTQSAEIAFNFFFGRPVLIVEHHEVFQNPLSLVQVVSRINKIAPNIHWSNLSTIARNSVLWRRTPDGVQHVRAYAGVLQLSNESGSVARCSIEWESSGEQEIAVVEVVQNGTRIDFTRGPAWIQFIVDLPAGSWRTYRLVHQNPYRDLASLGFRRKMKAFVRRRLSEIRDNYFSKNPYVLTAAKTFQRCFLH